MIIYFADRKLNILGHASTNRTAGIVVTDDKKTEEVENGSAVFECNVPFDKDTRKKAEEMTLAGNYLLRKNGDEAEFYTIIDSEVDTSNQEISIYAEDAGLDLLNEVLEPHEADKAYGIAHYVEKFAYDSGFEIGINEISDLTRTLKWTSEDTATSRLLSVATEFDNAELSFSFEIDGLSVSKKLINIHKKRGTESGVQIRLNRDIDNITIKKSVANLATALRCTGGTPEGGESPITLSGYSYDDGDFYVNGSMLQSRNALSKWSRYLTESGTDVGHIVKTFTYDTTSQSELCNRALTELKKICDIEINYEVDVAILPSSVKIGDTIEIVDEEGALYLTARVLKLERSIVDDNGTATLGNYLIKEGGIDQTVKDLAEEFKNIAQPREFYTWIAYADDNIGTGISLDPAGKKYMGTSTNNLIKEPSMDDPTRYVWSLIIGADGKPGEPGKDGEDGEPGKDGLGIFDTSIMYQAHTSGVNIPTGKWLETIPDVPENQYLWTRTIITYTDRTTSTSYSVGKMGATGIGVKSITNYYLATDAYSGVTTGTSGWTTDIQSMTEEKCYLWSYETLTYTDNSTSSTKPIIIGVYGASGSAGKGIQSIEEWYLKSKLSSGVTAETSGWTNAVQSMTPEFRYLWNYEVITYTDGSKSPEQPRIIGVYGEKGEPGKDGADGQDGQPGADAISVVLSNESHTFDGGTATANSGYTHCYVRAYKGDTRLAVTIGNIAGCPNGMTAEVINNGTDNANFKITVGTNMSSKSGVLGIPIIVNGQSFLKNFSYSLALKGENGSAGVSVDSVTEKYAVSSSKTTPPTTWYDEAPELTATNKYLWNYEIINFSSGQTGQTPKCVIGVYGDKGDTGATGKGVKSITNYYLATPSATGVTTQTQGWTAAVQSVSKDKKYLWNYESIIYTDNTVSTTTPCVIGAYGDTGMPGSDGTTYYTWIKYADDETGSGISDNPVGKKYIGIAYNKASASESTSPNDYDWSRLKGEDAAIQSKTEPADKTKLWWDTSSSPAYIKQYNSAIGQWEVANDFASDIQASKEQITTEYTSSIEDLRSSISAVVQEVSGSVSENKLTIDVLTSQLQQNSTSITGITTSIKEITDNITGLATKEEISQWARFQNGVLTLGESNSPFSVRLSTTELGFYQNDTRIAYLSNQQLHITQAVVLEKINLGTFTIECDTTNGFTIR